MCGLLLLLHNLGTLLTTVDMSGCSFGFLLLLWTKALICCYVDQGLANSVSDKKTSQASLVVVVVVVLSERPN
jgi:asparagine N-glycosylation enzyme membrane subunit Stt3